jgi:Tfp pilus assembly protein PilN
MISINLLPKQYTKKSGKFSMGKQGAYMLLAAFGVLAVFGLITGYQLYKINELEGQMEIARARTMQLQKDIALVDGLMDIKAKLTDRLEAVERLDRHRSAWVRILEDFSKNIPDFVWLSRFDEITDSDNPTARIDTTTIAHDPSGPQVMPVEVEGFAFTLNALASFMIKMMRSDYFDQVDLLKTEELVVGNQKAYNFKVSCNVHYLSDEDLERIVAQRSAGSDTNSKQGG